jgi:Pyruvate/2-oxoacid:ferredoxin oxidoreductase gamma subunit
LRELNQYRVEGIFILEKKSYDDLVSVFNVILNNSRKEKDFESINLCMILSQTFYKISKDNIFLQTEVKKNEIWKKHSFWEEIIEFSIKEKIYNTKGFLIFLEENEEEREERVKQAANSILITFLYNMQLFDMSKEERKKIINKFVKKYDIKNFMFLDNELEVDEINDEVIIESVASNLDIQPEE